MAEKSTTSKPTRIFMLVIALLFLFSASAFTVLVIYSSVKSNNSDDTSSTKETQTMLQGTELKNFTPVSNVKKLKIIDLKKGSGQAVKAGDKITVQYTGAVASTGIIFQSTKDLGQPATFPLTGVIEGWQKGIPGMKVGGVRRLVIPAKLAYGSQSQPGIPANSDLVFDITLQKIDK